MRAVIVAMVVLFAARSASAGETDRCRGRILKQGIYVLTGTLTTVKERGTEKHFWDRVLSQETTKIPAERGLQFGMSFVLEGSCPTVATVRISHPPLADPLAEEPTTETTLSFVNKGQPLLTVYRFDEQWEMKPGQWTFAVLSGERRILETRFKVFPSSTLSDPSKTAECDDVYLLRADNEVRDLLDELDRYRSFKPLTKTYSIHRFESHWGVHQMPIGEDDRLVAKVQTIFGRCKPAPLLGSGNEQRAASFLRLATDVTKYYEIIGKRHLCAEVLRSVDDYYPEWSSSAVLKPYWDTLGQQTVFARCGCSWVTKPLCAKFSWVDRGYTEIEETVDPSVGPLTFRTYFEKERYEKAPGAMPRQVRFRLEPKKIEILRDEAPFQTLTFPEEDRGFDTYRVSTDNDVLRRYDMNFDGFLDLMLARARSDSGCGTFYIWLYSPKERQFKLHRALTHMCFYDRDEKNKEIVTKFQNRACYKGERRYRWNGDELVKVSETIQPAGKGCRSGDLPTG